MTCYYSCQHSGGPSVKAIWHNQTCQANWHTKGLLENGAVVPCLLRVALHQRPYENLSRSPRLADYIL